MVGVIIVQFESEFADQKNARKRANKRIATGASANENIAQSKGAGKRVSTGLAAIAGTGEEHIVSPVHSGAASPRLATLSAKDDELVASREV